MESCLLASDKSEKWLYYFILFQDDTEFFGFDVSF